MLKGVKKSRQNRQATVIVIRNGQELHLPVRFGPYPSRKDGNASSTGSVHPGREEWGLTLLDLNPHTAAQLQLDSDRGLIVVAVQPGSRAEATGLHRGDVITAVRSDYRCHC